MPALIRIQSFNGVHPPACTVRSIRLRLIREAISKCPLALKTSNMTQGKTTEHADIFHGIFEELITNERIAEAVNFESDDPAFHGIMKVITILEPVNDGTKVTIRCEQVREG